MTFARAPAAQPAAEAPPPTWVGAGAGTSAAQVSSLAARSRAAAMAYLALCAGVPCRASAPGAAGAADDLWVEATSRSTRPGMWGSGSAGRSGLPDDLRHAAGPEPQPRRGGRHLADASLLQNATQSALKRQAVYRKWLGRMTQRHPSFEIVVSRSREEVAWLFRIPEYWKITIYTSVAPQKARLWPVNLAPQSDLSVINFAHDTFATAFAHHLVRRYDSLALYTVFAPAYPMQQSPALYDMLAHPALLASVQTMSLCVTENFPPHEVQKNDRPDAWYRSERFSMRTLEPLAFLDSEVRHSANMYRDKYGLLPNQNLLRHFFDNIGLVGWVSEQTEVGSFSYGGLFGVSRQKVTQHPVETYQKILNRTREGDPMTLFIERTWLILFAGEGFIDRVPRHWDEDGGGDGA